MKLFPGTLFGRMFLMIASVMLMSALMMRLIIFSFIAEPYGNQMGVFSTSLMIIIEKITPHLDTNAYDSLQRQLQQTTGVILVDNINERWNNPPDRVFIKAWQNYFNSHQTESLVIELRYQSVPDTMLWLLHTKPPLFSVGFPMVNFYFLPILIGLVFLLVTFVLMVTAYVLARYMKAPLEELISAARAIGRDTRSANIKLRGPDEIKAVAQALNMMKADLERLVKSQEFLLAGISHDLRIPLMRISIATELMSANFDDLSEGIKEDIEEMNGVLQRFIELARINIEEAEAWEIGDITPLLHNLVVKYYRSDIDILLSLDNILPVRYKPMALQRLLYNLIDNGLKHGGGLIKITTRINGDKTELCVTDQGPGLPMTPENLRAYSDFSEPQHYGSGLGLLIVQRIAQLHGAELTLRNNPLGGAEIILSLDACLEY
jgi:two-component system osmolarity sensor histidine kinase EnvZ